MIQFLKVFFILVLAFMIYEIVDVSLQSNLFDQLPALVKIPWMQATLWDFYANVLVLFVWIVFKEQNHLIKILWLILLVCLGSVATCIYVLKELFILREGEGIKELLTKQHSR